MPGYTVTVERECGCGEAGCQFCESGVPVVERHQAGTLEQAQHEMALLVGSARRAADPNGDHEAAWPEWDDVARACLSAESGAAVSLPDGSTITVEADREDGER